MVKVRGLGGSAPCSDLSPCYSMSPLTESIKCYFMSKNAKLVGCGMGMGFAPTWLRQVSPLASRDHLNHWVLCNVLLKYIYWRYSYSRSFSSEFRLHKVTGGYDLDFVKRDWNRSRDRRIEHSFKNGPKHYDNDKKLAPSRILNPSRPYRARCLLRCWELSPFISWSSWNV